jgi:threonine efflux protein
MDYTAFALLMLAAQFSPGPDMLLLLRNAAQHPLRAGLCTVLGIVCGLTVHTSLALTGVAVLLQQSASAVRVLSAAGGAYLLWLAARLLRGVIAAPPPESADARHAVRPLAGAAAFRQGLITNLLNPKAAVFLLSALTAALGPEPGTGRKLAFAGIILGQALAGWSVFVWLLQRPGVAARYRRAGRWLDAAFGAGLALLGLQALAGAL